MDFILIDLQWFLVGAFLFTFFSFVKTHIYVKVQPGVMHGDIRANNPFGSYPKRLWKDTKKGGLFKSTFQYLFRSKKADWISIDNVKIDTGLEVLNSFTNVLKPYLVVSFLFFLIKGLLSSALQFEVLTVSLGNVQTLLSFIDNLPIVIFFFKYKTYIFLFLGILVILVPWLYARRKKTKVIKKYAMQLLVYFSLLTSVSFFGVKIGSYSAEQSEELREIQIKITSIHNQIFKTASKIAVETELTELIIAPKSSYEELITSVEKRRDKQAGKLSHIDTRTSILSSYNDLLKQIEKREQFDSTNLEKSRHLKVNTEFSAFKYASYLKADQVARIGTNEYLGNWDKWNIQEGEKMLDAVTAEYEVDAAKKLSKISPRTYEVVKKIADVILNKAIGEMVSFSPVTDNLIVKKILKTATTKAWRKRIYQNALAFLGFEVAVSSSETRLAQDLELPQQDKYTKQMNVIDAEHKALNDTRIKEEKERLKKANKRLMAEIKEIIHDHVIDAFTSESNIEVLDANRQSQLDDYLDGITRQMHDDALSGLSSDLASRNNSLLEVRRELKAREELTWLEKISSKGLKSATSLSFICTSCGLDVRVFPSCPVKIPLILIR